MRIHHATAAKAKKFGITLTVEDNEVVATKGDVRLAAGLQGNKVLEDAITKATGKPAKGGTPAARIAKTPAVVSQAETDCRELGWTKARGGGFKNSAEEETSDATTWEELAEELELVEGAGGDEPEADDEDDSDAEQGKSIVRAKYRALYKPHKDRCGDTLSADVNKHVSREDEAGEMKVDLAALRRFAKANGTWVESYASLRSRTGTWNSGQAIMNTNNRLRAKIRQAKKAGEEFEIKWV